MTENVGEGGSYLVKDDTRQTEKMRSRIRSQLRHKQNLRKNGL